MSTRSVLKLNDKPIYPSPVTQLLLLLWFQPKDGTKKKVTMLTSWDISGEAAAPSRCQPHETLGKQFTVDAISSASNTQRATELLENNKARDHNHI